MDSEPNTYKHGRVITAGVYIAGPLFKNTAVFRNGGRAPESSQFAPVSLRRGT